MSEVTILQVLQDQALERAIGELNAALQTMRVDSNGEFPALAKVIQECIERLRSEM